MKDKREAQQRLRQEATLILNLPQIFATENTNTTQEKGVNSVPSVFSEVLQLCYETWQQSIFHQVLWCHT